MYSQITPASIAMDIFEADRCKDLAKPSMPQFVVSCLLMAWLLMANIPQWARMISRQSAEGLSTFYVLLGSLSGVCAIGNIMVLPSSQVDIGCCRENTRFACVSGLLGLLQVILGIACFWVILFLYVYYAEEEAEAELHHRRNSISSPDRTFRRARRAWIILLVALAFAFTIMTVSAIILNRFPWLAHYWADFLGVSVALLACCQWVPQVWTTWHLGHLGSLSVASICMSAPYTWIFGVNMMIRVGLQGWSVWIVYVLVGTMQVTLIAMAMGFAIKNMKKAQKGNDESHAHLFDGWDNLNGDARHAEGVTPDEQSPLLPERR